ncbi:MAG: NUDIX hydrolase [Candidatus Roizmanbacteria bacterium]|nr:NUDIX hydrolase [Candidatus Roizmanbacteria bacterium]
MEITRARSKLNIPPHATRVFKGKMLDVYHWEQKMFDGTTAIFEKIKRVDTVNVLPITNDQKIVITHQEQPGIDPFIGSIGGRLDLEENPLEAAKRELLEEAGMVSDTWQFWMSVQPSSVMDWAIFTFIAKKCRVVKPQNLDSGEKISLKMVTFDEYLKIILDDNYRDRELTLAFLKAKEQGTLGEIKKLLFT